MKEMPKSWPQQNSGVFSKLSDAADIEPFSRAPVPSLSGFSFAPNPLLTVTPEKSLHKNSEPSDDREGKRKARQRVRFAPDTRTSPPSKGETAGKKSLAPKGAADGCKLGVDNDDDESMPRSFPPSCHKVYRPERYSDGNDGEATDSKAVMPPSSASELFGSSASSSSSSLSAAAPKAYTMETQGSRTYYVPLDRSSATITSDYSGLHKDKPLTATIVRHKASSASNSNNNRATSDTELKEASVVFRHNKPDNDNRASTRELKEAFESALEEELQEAFFQGSPSSQAPRLRSRSTSPASRHRRVRKVSPIKNRHHHNHHCSPSCSPSRLCRTPSPGQAIDVETLTPGSLDEGSESVVRVIREATYQPKHSDYSFPFGHGDRDGRQSQVYDSSVENQLARPEFNSALKVSQELKSVKENRPDTWAATNHKLKTCERKRTEIQEKASSRVNLGQGSGLFSGLVGVDLPLDDVCHSLETQISLRAPSPKPSAVKVPVGKEPDLMEFFTPDLQQELLDLTLTGLQPITASLSSADPIIAFDLYRHNRVWNGLSDS